jgi:hypothetical protein
MSTTVWRVALIDLGDYSGGGGTAAEWLFASLEAAEVQQARLIAAVSDLSESSHVGYSEFCVEIDEMTVADEPEAVAVRWSGATGKRAVELGLRPGVQGRIVTGEQAESLEECAVEVVGVPATLSAEGRSWEKVRAALDEAVVGYMPNESIPD